MIENIEKYAKENRIPIMLPDGIEYLCNYIKENNIKKILEIGTAIGYSAIKMASVNDNIYITTIEKDEKRYKEAIKNINILNLDKRINVLLKDALEIELKDKYDLIFIDASKGHNIDFFNKFKNNLNDNGVIITDNLSFHGLVENESLAITKNQKGIVKKIKLFIDFLDNNQEFDTNYIEIGDKISISKRSDKNEKNISNT
ncbi:MAG: O-methyltransferase [Bacilli bacterium]|nr:O-methyltransferase [Bacilli bacterium]